jgi:hypothetical protein
MSHVRARSFFEKRYLVYQRQNRFETPTEPPNFAVAAVARSLAISFSPHPARATKLVTRKLRSPQHQTRRLLQTS